jgi:hypothetical protein
MTVAMPNQKLKDTARGNRRGTEERIGNVNSLTSYFN